MAKETPLEKANRVADNLSKILTQVVQSIDEATGEIEKGPQSALKKAIEQMRNAKIPAKDIGNNIVKQLVYELNKQGKKINANTLIAQFNKMKGIGSKLKDTIIEALEAEDKLYLGMTSKAERLANELIKPFESLTGWIEKIPGGKLLSKMFGFDEIEIEIKKKIIEQLIEFGKTGKVTFAIIKDIGTSTFKSIGGALTALMTHPFLLFTALLIGTLYVAYNQWNKIVDAAKALRTETGLTGDAAFDLTQSTRDIALQFTNMSVSMETVGKAAAALVNEFQTIKALTHDMIKNASLMVGALGVAPDVAAKSLRVFKNMGVDTGQSTTNMIGLVSESAKLAGVAPSSIFKDLAESSKEIYTFFKGNVVNAAKAAIELRRMGTSIKEVAAVSKTLLDFESNITSELEASVLAGQQLDFSRARYLSFTGDLIGSQNAVLDQIEKINNFEGKNIIQKEAIAKASGMELDKLENMLEQRKEISKLGPKDKKAYDDSLAALEEFRKGNKTTLIQKNQQLLAQEKINKSWDDIIQKLSSVLFPLFDGLYEIINSIANAVQAILSSSQAQWLIGVFKTIGGWLTTISKTLGKIGLIAIPITIIAVIALKNAFGNLFGFLSGQFAKIGTWFKGTKAGGFLGKIFGSKKEIEDAAKGSKEMKSMGQRIKDFFQGFREVKVGDILKFALVLGVLAGGLYVFGLALKGFNDVKWDSVFKGIIVITSMVILSKLLKSATSDMLVGAIVLAALSGALYLFGLALEPFKDIKWETLAIAGVAIVGFALAIFALGAIIMTGVGAALFGAGIIGIIALSSAIGLLGLSFKVFENGKGGMDAMIDGIARLGALGADLFIAAAGIGAIGAALAAFGGGSIVAGIGSFIGNFLGGDPIEKMERLARIGPNLNIAAQSISALGAALNNIKVPDIANIDELSDIAEASLKIQANKETNVNVAAPDNNALLKKLDELVETMKSLEVKMDGKKVGEVISTLTPRFGRA